MIVSADSAGELRIWNRDQRKTTFDVQAHLLNVVDLAFSADGNRLVSASYDHDAVITDTRTGTVIHRLGEHTATFNPTRNERPPTILSIVTQQGHSNILTSCAISLNGEIVATGGFDYTVRLWSAESGQELGVLEHPSAITSVCFDPVSGQRLSTACWDDIIRVWDVTTQSIVLQFKASEGAHVTRLAYSPDGRVLATARDDGVLAFWDTSSGRQLQAMQAHSESLDCVSFDASGQRLVTGGKIGAFDCGS